MIDTVYHLWVKNNKGEGREGLKERGSLLTFFPCKSGGGGGGGLKREGELINFLPL